MFGRRKPAPGTVASESVEVRHPHGLGPHVALAIVAVSRRFRAKITLEANGREARADVGSLLLLGARCGDLVVVRCEGGDPVKALEAVTIALGGRAS